MGLAETRAPYQPERVSIGPPMASQRLSVFSANSQERFWAGGNHPLVPKRTNRLEPQQRRS